MRGAVERSGPAGGGCVGAGAGAEEERDARVRAGASGVVQRRVARAAAATVRLDVERRALEQPAEPLGIANLRWRGAGSLRAGRAGE